MHVLFVSSGNTTNGIGSIVYNQGQSLIKHGVDLEYFTIEGKGILGYLKAVFKLRRKLREKKHDIIHAHYSFSAFTASLVFKRPLVVSLMGSDSFASGIWEKAIKVFNSLFWDKVIVKSQEMLDHLHLKEAEIIPNGINFSRFKFIDKEKAQDIVGFNKSSKHVIFVANPNRPEKNFTLAQQAFIEANIDNSELHAVHGIEHEKIAPYMYAADVLLLTSNYEGSPNVIKEAMACGLPIVTTRVGDVQKTIANTEGCYISSNNAKDISQNLIKAIRFGKRTNGREKTDWLSEENIAKKITDIYSELLK